ncbi:FecCD family ABC transporter permease [Thioalkalivibrio thiocyanodenitrificans]|uniref:FecCD family ABC transporter permease n=1 Tax=Thioalkalivibrio thiocyanodenitrificans TaxID=243063 RepID=UPI000364A6AE|nr:iron ABC transporter permease [Thioalkalivibrio thiocyanodenitrificans]
MAEPHHNPLTALAVRHPATALASALFGCFVLSAWLGAELLGPALLLQTLADTESSLRALILHWRIPRVLTAFCVGACLGVAGVVFQGVFRNPLAEPYLLGSASGASVGAAIALLSPWVLPGPLALPLLAFVGAWGATWVVVTLARAARVEGGFGLILAGVAMAALLTSIRGLLMLALSDDTVSLQAVLSWTLGGIQTPSWGELGLLVVLTIAGLLACLSLARGLDVLGLGADTARSMGLDLDRFMHKSVLIAAAITALAVVWGGLIGFIGLVVPHVMRWWLGPRHGRLMLYSALGSGAVLMVFDGIARAALPPAEIPLGLLTALLGAPFFLFILIRESRR